MSIQTTVKEIIDAPVKEATSSYSVIRVLLYSGLLFIMGSLFSLGYMAIEIAQLDILKIPNEGFDNFTQIFISHYAVPIFFLGASIIAGVSGFLLIRIASRSTKKIIPDDDRPLLEEIIKSEKEEPIRRYISLSSLLGSVGIFTKVGLTGLPLATIALTLIFAILSFFESSEAGNFIDFTKLTLGAFLGSYVQRNVSQTIASTGIQED